MKRIFGILVMWAVAAVAAVAQTATVKSFSPALSDLTAQKYSRDDRNGVKCAVVKVQVIADNVQFQGGIIEPVEEKPGEYWVYMPAQEQRVLVMSKNFKPLMVEFDEPLQAGVTYVLDIEAPQIAGAVQPQKPRMSFLVLKVAPVTARVTIDGVAVPTDNGMVSKMLADGAHSYTVEEPGYATATDTVRLDGERVERTVTLRSTKPTLTVTSATPGTEIYVNEALKGTGNWSGELFADSYMVEGRKTGYRPVSEVVTLVEGEKRSVALAALEAITGALSVDYKPVGAKITLDGREAGVTPDVFRDLLIGEHTVEVSAQGYDASTVEVTVTEGETASISGSLRETPKEKWREYEYFTDKTTGKQGFKYRGEIVVPARYDYVGGYRNDGLATTINGERWGAIDGNGNEVIPCIYDALEGGEDDLRSARLNGWWGFLDKEGKTVLPFKYSGAGWFREGVCPVKLNGRWGFINKDGSTALPFIYDRADIFSDGLAHVRLNGKEVFIDHNGDVAVTPVLNYDVIGRYREGMCYVQRAGKYGNIDRTGREVIPCKYEESGFFHEGLGAAKLNGKYGFINEKDEVVIPFIYDYAWDFENGSAAVKLDGRTFRIDRQGNRL